MLLSSAPLLLLPPPAALATAAAAPQLCTRLCAWAVPLLAGLRQQQRRSAGWGPQLGTGLPARHSAWLHSQQCSSCYARQCCEPSHLAAVDHFAAAAAQLSLHQLRATAAAVPDSQHSASKFGGRTSLISRHLRSARGARRFCVMASQRLPAPTRSKRSGEKRELSVQPPMCSTHARAYLLVVPCASDGLDEYAQRARGKGLGGLPGLQAREGASQVQLAPPPHSRQQQHQHGSCAQRSGRQLRHQAIPLIPHSFGRAEDGTGQKPR